MSAPRSFVVLNFGCRAAQADGAALTSDLERRGLAAAEGSRQADLVVLNTCTVTAEADRDARQAIRRIHRENPDAEILVTGCYAQRKPDELADLPGVKWVIGNSHKTLIGGIVRPAASPTTPLVQIAGLATAASLAYHGEIAAGGTLVGDIRARRAFLSTPVVEAGRDRTRPNLKIQDGCNNRCSFCIIPSVRGLSRSAPASQVLAEIGRLAARHKEIVLSGINLGRWGRDLPGRPRLTELLRRILEETDAAKIRLSSIEPMDWTNDLLDLMASHSRIAKHVHIPLQSGSDSTLRAMRRRYRTRHYAERVLRARALMPCAAIGADVMVGFPGESEEDFECSRDFISRMPFTYLHVFTYSPREGTPAADAGNQVPLAAKKRRNRALQQLAAEKNLRFRESLIGRTFPAVTLDCGHDGATLALTDNYVHVTIPDQRLEPGRMVEVEIADCGPASTTARRAA